jgi:hypothetical protein
MLLPLLLLLLPLLLPLLPPLLLLLLLLGGRTQSKLMFKAFDNDFVFELCTQLGNIINDITNLWSSGPVS